MVMFRTAFVLIGYNMEKETMELPVSFSSYYLK